MNCKILYIKGLRMVQCAVPSCNSRSDTQNWKKNISSTGVKISNGIKITFHKLPRDPKKRKCWIELLQINQSSFKQIDNIRVCSRHFGNNCFDQRKKRQLLKADALPLLYENREKHKSLDLIKNRHSCHEQQFHMHGVENDTETEDYKISIKKKDESDYCFEHINIKEEKWNIENVIVKEEPPSIISDQDFENDCSNQIKVEVKEEPLPTTSDMNSDSEMNFEEVTDQTTVSSTIKTEYPVENPQFSASSLQGKPPIPLTNCQLPANSVLLLLPTVPGTSSTPSLINLNISPVSVSNIIPNSPSLLNLNVKPSKENHFSPLLGKAPDKKD